MLTVLTGPVLFTQSFCLHTGTVSEKKHISENDWSFLRLLPWQIAGLLKDNEKIHASPAAAPTDDDSEIKKIKKVTHVTQTCRYIFIVNEVVEKLTAPFISLVFCRSRASCEAGSAGGSGRPSSRITSAHHTLRA